MNKKILLIAIVILAAAGGAAFLFLTSSKAPAKAAKDQQGREASAKKEPKILYYVDPMHPSYKSDKPGIAPDCGMRLTPVYAEDSADPEPEAKKEPKILYWVDPMNPSHKSDKPGKAPDGMDLTPVYAEEESGTGNETPGTVRLSGRKQQLMNLKIVEARESEVAGAINTVGNLQYDETKIARIHSKIEGWIDKVFVDYVGQYVKKGQPLFSIYSPDLVATQQEYLLALKAERTLGQSEFADVASGSQSLKASALKRLKLWDVSDSQIAKLEETGIPMTSITFYSPVSGFVTEKNVFDKQRVTYDTETYAIVDLSTIWLMADIYEYEAAGIRLGQKAVMSLTYQPDRKYEGKVTYIYPSLNSTTRTLKVRIEFRNAGFELKPDMYANVEIATPKQANGIVIPEDAVLDSGSRKVVFVQKAEGEFEPREVKTGEHFDGNVVILSGVSAGEKVVAAGNFLIDSESQMKSALQGMGSGDHKDMQ